MVLFQTAQPGGSNSSGTPAAAITSNFSSRKATLFSSAPGPNLFLLGPTPTSLASPLPKTPDKQPHSSHCRPQQPSLLLHCSAFSSLLPLPAALQIPDPVSTSRGREGERDRERREQRVGTESDLFGVGPLESKVGASIHLEEERGTTEGGCLWRRGGFDGLCPLLCCSARTMRVGIVSSPICPTIHHRTLFQCLLAFSVCLFQNGERRGKVASFPESRPQWSLILLLFLLKRPCRPIDGGCGV